MHPVGGERDIKECCKELKERIRCESEQDAHTHTHAHIRSRARCNDKVQWQCIWKDRLQICTTAPLTATALAGSTLLHTTNRAHLSVWWYCAPIFYPHFPLKQINEISVCVFQQLNGFCRDNHNCIITGIALFEFNVIIGQIGLDLTMILWSFLIVTFSF